MARPPTTLKVGDVVPAAAPSSDRDFFNEEGMRHGLIFGDGSINYSTATVSSPTAFAYAATRPSM